VVAALSAQIDLDVIPTDGLVIFRNNHALPPVAVTSDAETISLAARASTEEIQRLDDTTAVPTTVVPGGWAATTTVPGALLLASEWLPGYRASDAEGTGLDVATSFGWAMRVTMPPGEVHVRYADQWQRTAGVWVLAILWIAALWITRKPGSSR
jgi:hypothetical protein